MKKTLVAAITSALVIGAASTTFAAANPFSDVPADHWAFDAVATLAQEGVIEGYGDNTFNGDAHITRYEMAQMVAKAMAKDGLSAESKAMVERLAAEFADELDNLGVRVANLEKRVDNVKFNGMLRILHEHQDNIADDITKGRLRLETTAKVNEDWAVKGRMDIDSRFDNNGSGDLTGKRLYAEGPLLGATAKLGRFGSYDNGSFVVNGMLIDSEASGAEFTFGNKLTTKLTYARLGDNTDQQTVEGKLKNVDFGDYGAIELAYRADKFGIGLGYAQIEDFYNVKDNSNGLFHVVADYKFDKNLALGGLYAKSDVDDEVVGKDQDDAYSVQLNYKGANKKDAGSYGAWVAYRELGSYGVIAPTYDSMKRGQKGFEVGVNYALAQNILGQLIYADSERITDGENTDRVFAKVEFFF